MATVFERVRKIIVEQLGVDEAEGAFLAGEINEDAGQYRVFENGKFVASFEPDAHNFLHICQNKAELNEELLYELADQIEVQIPHASPHHINGKEDEE